jgi:uncharacterized membrane protein
MLIVVATWNLFLAALPVFFGRALARRLEAGGPRSAWIATFALGAAWLAFLPNAPYLLTDFRHFVLGSRWRELAEVAPSDPAALRATAAWGLVFASYAALGGVLMVAAIRPVERALEARGLSARALRAVLFPLVALGVWIGLIPRFNSWDLLTRPMDVVGSALWAVTHLPTAVCIAVFAGVLAALHVVLDAAWRGLRARGVETA